MIHFSLKHVLRLIGFWCRSIPWYVQCTWSTRRHIGCAASNSPGSKTWPEASTRTNSVSWYECTCEPVVSRAQGHTSQASWSSSPNIQGSCITSSSIQWRRIPSMRCTQPMIAAEDLKSCLLSRYCMVSNIVPHQMPCCYGYPCSHALSGILWGICWLSRASASMYPKPIIPFARSSSIYTIWDQDHFRPRVGKVVIRQ